MGVAVADGVAVGEWARPGVPDGDAERVGVCFGVGVADVVGGGAVRLGAVEVEGCPVGEELPAFPDPVGLTST